MKVIGFSGYSGAGKTTLIERVIGCLRDRGQRVSVVKHAHHAFDIDQQGKDSWRHRQAGAFEIVIASDQRLAKIREYELSVDPTVHDLLAELTECDWALVEGFRRAALPKIEVWREANGKPVQYPDDPHMMAICTDDIAKLPVSTTLPLLDLDDAVAVVDFMQANAERCLYVAPSMARGPIGHRPG